MKGEIKVGVIGAGAIAKRGHLPFFDASSRVGSIAVADLSAARLDEARSRFGKVERTYDSFEAMLEKEDLDCVSICLPNRSHAEAAVMAAERSLHVLCEKPMASNVEDAEKMIDACRCKSVILMIDLTYRFFSGLRIAREMIFGGGIGTPHAIYVRLVQDGLRDRVQRSDWFYDADISGGGALIDMGVHAVDICHYLIGPIRRVSASLANLAKGIEVEDNAILTAEIPDDRHAIVEVGWSGSPGFFGVRVFGSDGGLTIDFNKGLLTVSPAVKRERASGTEIECDPTAGGWKLCIDSFISHVSDGTRPDSDGYAGLSSLEVIRAAYESHRTGRKAEVIRSAGF